MVLSIGDHETVSFIQVYLQTLICVDSHYSWNEHEHKQFGHFLAWEHSHYVRHF